MLHRCLWYENWAMDEQMLILPTLYHLMKPVVHAMDWVMRERPSMSVQLKMLCEGMTGDVEPRAFTAENIQGMLPVAIVTS